MGFLFNSAVNKFVKKRPELYASQLLVKHSEYHFLPYDSYLDCARIFPFDHDQLSDGRGQLNKSTQSAIKGLVAKSATLEQRYIRMILAN